MLACAESNLSKFKFEYLHENEFLRKTILACLSGDHMCSIIEKNRGQKSRNTAPLSLNLKLRKNDSVQLFSWSLIYYSYKTGTVLNYIGSVFMSVINVIFTIFLLFLQLEPSRKIL